jgi:hypothetical protein
MASTFVSNRIASVLAFPRAYSMLQDALCERQVAGSSNTFLVYWSAQPMREWVGGQVSVVSFQCPVSEKRKQTPSNVNVGFSGSEMSIRNFMLFAVATLSGIGAMGCWVLTQADAAITLHRGSTVLLVMISCVLLFGTALSVSAFAATRRHGARAFISRTMFLVGLFGTITLLFFVVSSWGKIFFFGPIPTVLLSAFLLLALFFRPRTRKRAA